MGRLEDDIKRFSRIAIDTNAFIYLIERHTEYFNVVRELFNAVEIGKVYAVSSVPSSTRGEKVFPFFVAYCKKAYSIA